jgi:hypothetical protein
MVKSFITLCPSATPIKFIFFVHDAKNNKLECFLLEDLSTIVYHFAGKIRSLPKSGTSERCFTLIGSKITHKLGGKGLPGTIALAHSIHS